MSKANSANKVWVYFNFFSFPKIQLPTGILKNVNCVGNYQGRLAICHQSGHITFVLDENTVNTTKITGEPIEQFASSQNSSYFYTCSRVKKQIGGVDMTVLLVQAFKLTSLATQNQDDFDVVCSYEIPLETGQKPYFFKTNDDGNILAISLDPNSISIFRLQTKSATLIPYGTYQISEPITNIHITTGYNLSPLFFITSNAGIYTLSLKKSMQKPQIKLVPGSPPVEKNKSCISQPGFLAVCVTPTSQANKKTTILFFKEDGPHSSPLLKPFSIDEKPEEILWYKDYLISRFKKNGNDTKQHIIIYDIQLHSKIGKNSYSSIDYILPLWGSLIIVYDLPMTPENYKEEVVIQDGTQPELHNIKISKLEEKSNEDKVKYFTDLHQYDKAIQICEANHLPPRVKADVYKQQADYRLENYKDYSGAAELYINTIGYVEPSHVIIKFLEPQHAEYLLAYLDKLGNEEKSRLKIYTTLRFNCLTKLKHTKDIEDIVQNCVDEAAKNIDDPPFDVDAAVNMLSSAGYLQEAIKIGNAFHRWDSVCSLFARENNFAGIFEATKTMPVIAATRIINIYGAQILEDDSLKQDFTDFVAYACTTGLQSDFQTSNTDNSNLNLIANQYTPLTSTVNLLSPSPSAQNFNDNDNREESKSQLQTIDPERIYSSFINDPKMEYRLYTQIIHENKSTILSEKLWNRTIILCISQDPLNIINLLENPQAKYSDEFVETALVIETEKVGKSRVDYKKLTKTKKEKPETELPDWYKAFDYDQNKSIYEVLRQAKALILVKRGCYREVINVSPAKDILPNCIKYSDKDPGIWRYALDKFRKHKHPNELNKLINYVLENGIIRLNDLLKIVEKIDYAKFDMFSKVTYSLIEDLDKLVNEKLIKLENNDKLLEKTYQEAENLDKKPYNIVFNRKCESCHQDLNGDVRYFKCGHYFHLSCLGDEPQKCPICANAIERATNIKLKRFDDLSKQEELLPKMVGVDDGIDVLERMLETGVMMEDNMTKDDIQAFHDTMFGD